LREAGFDAAVVSVGSTPTAHFAENLSGVTEVRAGVFVFLRSRHGRDRRVPHRRHRALGARDRQRPSRRQGWTLIDAGWMALSRDRGTAKQPLDQGYGVVCDIDGHPIDDLIVVDSHQEHGVIAHTLGRARCPRCR
jgi:D-serine deaminase-like pyridoxal phosphate-dependent protein